MEAAGALEFNGRATLNGADRLCSVLDHVRGLSAECRPFAAALAEDSAAERIVPLVAAGLAYLGKRDAAEGVFADFALSVPVAHMRMPLSGGQSLFGRIGGAYRTASTELAGLMVAPLPKQAERRLAVLDQLLAIQAARGAIASQESAGAEVLGPLWQEENTNFEILSQAIPWIEELRGLMPEISVAAGAACASRDAGDLQSLADNIDRLAGALRDGIENLSSRLAVHSIEAFGAEDFTDVELATLRARISAWSDSLDRYDEWVRLDSADRAARDSSVAAVADAVWNGTLAAEQAVDALRYLRAEALYRIFAADHPWVGQLSADEKRELVDWFGGLERKRFAASAQQLRAHHLRRLPQGGMGAIGVIKGEISKRKRHKPIRWLVANTGPVLQQVKPVFLMSPISVAQFVPPGKLAFDLLVIDEASQVRPEDAIGAIARARQVVVVGDSKQLPPTSFFDRLTSDGGDDEEPDEEHEIKEAAPLPKGATDQESILTLCDVRGLPSRMLNWHYRSRHPSLIEVSNAEFYKGGLVLFPSPDANRDSDGFVLKRVDGAYDRGGRRTNEIEAREVVRAIASHARTSPERSLGVATFASNQRDMITELLEVERRRDRKLDAFLREGRDEDFFVKNLENVQGDERDVIFVSVGYGPRIAGQRLDSMVFGPVSNDGGARRLNVLFTRARHRTLVFVSFDPGDIDPSRTRFDGVRVLQRYLRYAQTGISDEQRPTGNDPDSEFEVAVAEHIRSLGYEADYQVGSAGFRVDIAVRHPEKRGRYMLGVECDGARYHSALWARERDRQRQEVLEGLGWRIHRVWSTDWFHRRAGEAQRLARALEDARTAPPPGASSPASSPQTPEAGHNEVTDDAEQSPAQEHEPQPPYLVADFAVDASSEPHEISSVRMAKIVAGIIDVEGPVHQDEVARRVATLFGKERTGSRIQASARAGLRLLARDNPEYRSREQFWFTASQEADPPVRDRANAPQTVRKPEMLPPAEIAAAVKMVLRANGALDEQEIPRAVAQLFGFRRTGPEFRPVVAPIVERMRDAGEIGDSSAGMVINGDPGPA